MLYDGASLREGLHLDYEMYVLTVNVAGAGRLFVLVGMHIRTGGSEFPQRRARVE